MKTLLEFRPMTSMRWERQSQRKNGFSGISTRKIVMLLPPRAGHMLDLELRTSIAIAFARSPMVAANISWDLQRLNGNFTLGLGSQAVGYGIRASAY